MSPTSGMYCGVRGLKASLMASMAASRSPSPWLTMRSVQFFSATLPPKVLIRVGCLRLADQDFQAALDGGAFGRITHPQGRHVAERRHLVGAEGDLRFVQHVLDLLAEFQNACSSPFLGERFGEVELAQHVQRARCGLGGCRAAS